MPIKVHLTPAGMHKLRGGNVPGWRLILEVELRLGVGGGVAGWGVAQELCLRGYQTGSLGSCFSFSATSIQ